jgi:tetratricopeptide (TPR) repeat protein
VGSADLLRERILDIAQHGRRSPRAGMAAVAVSIIGAGVIAVFAAEPPKKETLAVTPASRPGEDQAVPPEGFVVYRARIAFAGLSLPIDEKEGLLIEEFFGLQIETLQRPILRKRAEERTRALHPEITPVPVTLTASRVPKTAQIDIVATGASALYVQSLLDSLLDEMGAYRRQEFENSFAGTMEKVDREVLAKEKRIKDLAEKYSTASSQKASQEKLQKLKAQLDQAHNDLQAWVNKAEEIRTSMRTSNYQPPPEFRILERASLVENDGKNTSPQEPPTLKGATMNSEALLQLAYTFYNLGEYDKAIKSFQDVLRIDPSNGAARRGMERAEVKRSEIFDAARDHLRSKMLNELTEGWEPYGSGRSAGAYYAEKMNKIIFPQVQFKGASVEEAVEFLRIKSRDYDTVEKDPSKRGVNLLMKPGLAPTRALITLDLKDVPMVEALKKITELGGMAYHIEAFAVVVAPLSELFTRSFKVPPDFLTGAVAWGKGAASPESDKEGPGTVRQTNAIDVLRGNGISFPEGASASFVPATSQLIVKNTVANLDKVEALVEDLRKKAQKQ